MVAGAYRRLLDPSFPPELRSKVLRAGVLGEITSFYSSSGVWKRMAYMSVFGLDYLTQPVRFRLEREAEQAFLEAVIFRVDVALDRRNKVPELSLPPDFQAIGTRIRHLGLTLRITISAAQQMYFPDLTWAINGAHLLKLHFPKLRAFVFTLDMGSTDHHAIFDPSVLLRKYPHGYGRQSSFPTLGVKLAELLDVFTRAGLGKCRFILIKYWGSESQRQREKLHYGPLVEADMTEVERNGKDTALGTRLLAMAHQFRRDGPRTVSEEDRERSERVK